MTPDDSWSLVDGDGEVLAVFRHEAGAKFVAETLRFENNTAHPTVRPTLPSDVWFLDRHDLAVA